MSDCGSMKEGSEREGGGREDLEETSSSSIEKPESSRVNREPSFEPQAQDSGVETGSVRSEGEQTF